MSKTVPSQDRILNRTAVTDPLDKTALNAENAMLIYDSILDGSYNQKLKGGTEVNKPTTPEVNEIYLVNETNYFAFEVYTSFGWLILRGIWTNRNNRPPTTGLAPFSEGFNIDESIREMWDGTEWRNS